MDAPNDVQELTAKSVEADVGGERKSEQLFAALYGELHRLAEHHVRRNAGATLGPTTLLHEAYLSMSARDAAAFPDRSRFLAYASRAMRGLVIDYARRGRARKRGRHLQITLDADAEVCASNIGIGEELATLGDALSELSALDASLAELVDLHFFCGFSFVEIAALRGVSDRTVQRDWRKARIVLHRSLSGVDADSGSQSPGVPAR